MLTLDIIKNKTEEVIARLAVKHFDGREKIERIIELEKIQPTDMKAYEKHLRKKEAEEKQAAKSKA